MMWNLIGGSESMRRIDNPRELAILCMREVEDKHQLIPEAMMRYTHSLSAADLQLCHELLYGTYRFRPGLERTVRSFLPRYENIPFVIRRILMMGCYQLIQTRIPDYAVINESVELCERQRVRGLKGLVNAVLRRIAQQKDNLSESLRREPGSWLLPAWWFDWLKKTFPEQFGRWCEGWLERPQHAAWSTRSLRHVVRTGALPHAFFTEETSKPHIYIQNESSQAIGELVLSLKPHRFWDCCAAPGGKSFYINHFGNLERHLASDSDHHRLLRMRDNLHRLDLAMELREAEVENAARGEIFDTVLVDAPCSSLGIVGRHPEIKLLRSGSADAQLLDQQMKILNAAWPQVKPGGHLLYTVCTLDPMEIPKPPPEAELDHAAIRKGMPAGVPWQATEHGFLIEPSPRFDGFLGMLLRKPESPEPEEQTKIEPTPGDLWTEDLEGDMEPTSSDET
jgi:16S rRNA (cytosine967-C5)-methyltransferase